MADLLDILNAFDLPGHPRAILPITTGHINDTYVADCGPNGRVILQRVNHFVFKNPRDVADNIRRVTEHISAKLPQGDSRRVLRLIPLNGRDIPLKERDIPLTESEGFCYEDASGGFWRVYNFIERAHTRDQIDSPATARSIARAFGQFQRLLIDLPRPRLADTIPDFHNTPKRLSAFLSAMEENASSKRAGLAKAEIDFAVRNQSIASLLWEPFEKGLFPERIAHNDTKINNIMLDDETGEALSVIDLDTVMPGFSLNDFGDMVRTAANSAAEDERDLSRVRVRLDIFEALAEGYLSEASDFLTDTEKGLLIASAKAIIYEQGIRFLGDYLQGDVYYKVSREGHNLERARVQFRLLESIMENEDEMTKRVAGIAGM